MRLLFALLIRAIHGKPQPDPSDFDGPPLWDEADDTWPAEDSKSFQPGTLDTTPDPKRAG